MITKAIIPAAGLGTRFLPQTKAMPKEMLPIIDKPLIQLVIEELVGVGVTDIIIVTGTGKRAIEDHFDRAIDLEQELIKNGKLEEAQSIKKIAEMANFVYVRQKGEPKGNARPVLNAMHLIGDEPFYVFFPDDFFICPGKSRAQQLLDTYEKYHKPTMSLIEIDKQDAYKYGVVKTGKKTDDSSFEIESIVEKPTAKEAPSNFASVGGYILTPKIMPFIENLMPAKNGEIILANAIEQCVQQETVMGTLINGNYHDGGDKLSYIKAVIGAALQHEEFHDDLTKYLKQILKV
ncbi:UTP--glucose-1-phosphate uridylyltransferase [Candidatus Saccharibacteria bacterium]|nr:UTP--glucose-1-phosphate uridylyltransferase [Candidatus Saccharibacteria bacterium]